MKYSFLIIFMCNWFATFSQTNKTHSRSNNFTRQRYITFNPLGLVEPQTAIGAGISVRLTKRSGYFAELSYLCETPFYKWDDPSLLNGFRLLLQFRDYFDLGKREDYFWAIEFRMKGSRFEDTNTFVEVNGADTLRSLPYKATALSLGGAALFGINFLKSANNRFKIEFTAGIGVKQKLVKYKNLPGNYEPIKFEGGSGLKIPSFYEPRGMPYFPVCLRLMYKIS